MSEETYLISMHPVIRSFVFSIIRTIREKDFSRDEKIVVDASLTPKLSDNTMKASMRINAAKHLIKKNKPIQVMERKAVPVRPRIMVAPNLQRVSHIHRRIIKPVLKVVVPVSSQGNVFNASEEYGKVSPLLNDSSVSTIECIGKGKELMIIRMGQKQRTRIVLTAEEISEFLEKIADKTHIPLMDGVFRASLDGFSINAVISKVIGSRFILKKSTPYNLLE